jgi:hypothetical protein
MKTMVGIAFLSEGLAARLPAHRISKIKAT